VNRIGRGLRSFGRFWIDFLIGDTPEIFAAVLILIGAAYGLRHDRLVAVIVLPALAAAVLAASTWRGRRRVADKRHSAGAPQPSAPQPSATQLSATQPGATRPSTAQP